MKESITFRANRIEEAYKELERATSFSDFAKKIHIRESIVRDFRFMTKSGRVDNIEGELILPFDATDSILKYIRTRGGIASIPEVAREYGLSYWQIDICFQEVRVLNDYALMSEKALSRFDLKKGKGSLSIEAMLYLIMKDGEKPVNEILRDIVFLYDISEAELVSLLKQRSDLFEVTKKDGETLVRRITQQDCVSRLAVQVEKILTKDVGRLSLREIAERLGMKKDEMGASKHYLSLALDDLVAKEVLSTTGLGREQKYSRV